MNRTLTLLAALLLAPFTALLAAEVSPLHEAPTAPARSAVAGLPLSRLKVSDNKRFLVTQDGKPFFWLGDTAWELFHRLDREEADFYLRDRAARGFNVIHQQKLIRIKYD